MISFIVPAYNEQALIGRTLEALNHAAEQTSEPYEVVVADDASSDRTAEIAQNSGAHVVRVNLRQIAATRNAGAREAIGDKLIFVDADTLVTMEVVRAAIEAMNQGAAGGGCAVNFDGQLPRYARLAFPVMVRLFRATGFACGCFLFCTRRAFDAVGGFDETLFASEEITMSRALKRQGPFVVLRESVMSSGRKMRMYSGREVLGLFGGILLGGPKSLKKRDGLEVWYGGRREESEVAATNLTQN